MDKIKVTRISYTHGGKVIYEWEQTLEEVHLYMKPPPDVTAKMIQCKIGSNEMTLAFKDNSPFISEQFYAYINSSEAIW